MEPPALSPIANFTFSPLLPSDIETVVFEDFSNDSDGVIVSYFWDFGDNETSTEINPQHQYSDNGIYPVYLIVTDNDGLTGNISRNITIINVAPEAAFDLVSSLPHKENTPIFFMDNSSDPDGKLVNWTWNLGDGFMAYGKAITHTYTKQGRYNVTLTVMDDDYDTDIYIHELFLEKEDKDTGLTPGFEVPLLCSIILVAVFLKRKQYPPNKKIK
jgi:PKD repeat protein